MSVSIVYRMMSNAFRRFIMVRSYNICSLREFSANSQDANASIGKHCSSGGSIREAGGRMGQVAVAKEEEYFYKKQKEQLEKLKKDLGSEIEFHKEQVKKHEDAVARHMQRISDIGN